MKKEGFILSNYELKGILGKGTFSKVKLAINKITKEKVAIKIIDKQKALNKNSYERIKREISILKNISHPNVIKVIDTKEDSNNYYFIMEYCQNGELFLLIANNKRLDEKKASFYFFQLINGLNYLHINRIVHRDLKPENLLLSKEKILKIIDFGLSNYTLDNQYLNTPCGSPSYASPEMIKGRKYNGFLSDIWSCGIILYVMLCGYLPFEGFSNNDLFRKILKCKVNYPKSIDKTAVDLMKNILVTDPENRFDINKIKQHPFYLRGKNIFIEKFPDLIREVEQPNTTCINKTLKKSISDSFNNNIKINRKKSNRNNHENGNFCGNQRINNLSNSVNKKNNIKKENNIIEKKMDLKNNNENNLYSNLLSHTKNINYYKKILSGRLTVHNINRNKNKIDDNNINKKEKTPRYKNLYENDNNLNELNLSISKKSELSSIKKNKNNLSNSLNKCQKEQRNKNIQINLKNNPYNNIKNDYKIENSNLIKTIDKYENNKNYCEEKKGISTTSFNENTLKSKIGCQSPNFLLLKKLLKNSQNYYGDQNNNNIQQSIVFNAQKERQIFNINQTINKIKKLKRIYENEINNNDIGNEIKNREYFSTHNSNSNFQISIKNSKTKIFNDISQNNYIYHKKNIHTNFNDNIEISPVKKIGLIFNGLNSNEKKDSQRKKISIPHNFNNSNNNLNNNELFIHNNDYNIYENNKEIYINNNLKNNKKNDNSLFINDPFLFHKNSNHPSLCIQSPKKFLKDKFNINNQNLENQRNDGKYITTYINTSEKTPLSTKNMKIFIQNKNNSSSIKVNKKSKNKIRNKNNVIKQRNVEQCSLTNKLNSIKKNFNLSNKDIFIFENKNENIKTYINNNNAKFDSTRSQKFINNRSLGEVTNISDKNDINRKRNQYSSILEYNSIYSENHIKEIRNHNSNKGLSKSEKKINDKFGLFNNRNNFLKRHKNIIFNDEDLNTNNRKQNKYSFINHFEKNYIYSEKFTLYNENSNLENKNEINSNLNNKKSQKQNKNRSVSNKKDNF